MNSLLNRSKKIFICFVAFALILISSLCFVVLDNKSKLNEVYATEQTYNFTNYDSSTGYPYKVSNFTISNSGTTAKHGVINIDSNVFSKNYEKYGLEKDDSNIKKYQDSDDNYVLMINSTDEPRSLGYSSKELTFKKGGHYRVAINVLTDNVTASSSLYLFNGNDTFAKFSSINTQGNWKTYYFYFSTNDYEDLNLKIGLWQGSKEYTAKTYVLFDSVNTCEISKATLNEALQKTKPGDAEIDGKTVFTRLNGNIYYKNLAGENVLQTISMNEEPFKTGESNNNSEGVYSYYNAEKVFKIRNINESYNSFEGPEFEMLPNKVYKFSIKARVGNMDSGSAYIKLVEVVEDGKTGTDSGVLTFSSTSNSYDNDFVEYSIIANSDSLKERTVKLVIGLGQSSSKAKGEVYFKDYTISSVPYSAYSSIDTAVAKSVNYTTEGTTNDIKNYSFDLTEALEISNINEIKINKATDWSYITSAGQTAGVFNVKYFDILNKQGLTNFVNPGVAEGIKSTNNVLMLHNEIQGVLDCSSSSISLSKNSYYSVTVYAKTTIINGNDSVANIKLVSADKNNLVVGSVENITTNGEWKQYTILVKTGYEDINANLVLSLGSKDVNSNGYVFFDLCKLKASDETAFTSATESDELAKFDLSKPFATNNHGESIFFEGGSTNQDNTSVSKIVNLNDIETIKKYLDDAEIESIRTNEYDEQDVLLVRTTHDDCYKLNTKLNYSLTQDKNYVLSVDVFTAYLNTDNKDKEATAIVSLSDFENSTFSKVSTDEKWATYTFFITPESDVTTQILLGLGSEDVQSRGVAVFANISLKEVSEEEEFKELKNSTINSMVVGAVINDEEEEHDHDHDHDEINWVLLTSTLTAVVLILAVFAVAFKKVFKPGKKKVKKTKIEYDRNNTVMRQKYRKLAFLKRDKDIRILEKKLALLDEDKLDKENKYKELLSKVRQVKMANRNGRLDRELTVLNKELNHASKNVSKIGVQVNKINAEIAYMRTEAYLLDLEKRLTRLDEQAKAKGSSIEEILKSEDIDISEVEIEKDETLSEAISKADNIIAEEERLEQERLENERIEKERLEQEKLEQERLRQEEEERKQQELAELERLAKEKEEQEKQETNTESPETNVDETVNNQEQAEEGNNSSVEEINPTSENIENEEKVETIPVEEKVEDSQQENSDN